MSKLTINAMAVALLAATPVYGGAGIVNPSVDGNVVHARVELAGGISADLELVFEDASNLSVGSLGLSATLVDPFDPAIAARLPAQAAIPTAFPVLVQVAPPNGSKLSFRGIVSVSLYTQDLQYTIGGPFRLCAAAPGETFSDVTAALASGSLRAGGDTPDFATDYIILVILQSPASEVQDKIFALINTLAVLADEIEPIVYQQLEAQVDAVRTAIDDGDTVGALAALDVFTATVVEHSGEEIPDVWSATDDRINAGGQLRSLAHTLRFGLLELLDPS